VDTQLIVDVVASVTLASRNYRSLERNIWASAPVEDQSVGQHQIDTHPRAGLVRGNVRSRIRPARHSIPRAHLAL